MNQLIYEPVPEYDRDTALHEIESGNPEKVIRALLSLAFYDSDWRSVQNLCVNFSNDLNENVRGIAILCFGYIAHFQASLDTQVAIPIVIERMNDSSTYVRGNAYDALEDILMFCTPPNYSRAEALDFLTAEQIDKNLLGLFAITKNDTDSEFAQEICLKYSSHPEEIIRGQALKGFATIIYEHRQIDLEKVLPILSGAAKNDGYAGECARVAIECIETYSEEGDSD